MVVRKRKTLAALAICVALATAETPWCLAGVRAENASVRVAGCSGTIVRVGDATVGLSVAHGGAEVGKTVDVYDRHGTQYAAKWVRVDKHLDMALFVVTDPSPKVTNLSSAPGGVGSSLPRKEVSVRAYGFRAGKTLRPKIFSYLGTTTPSNLKVLRAHYSVKEGKFGNGDSGGGVFNKAGELVGVISHGSDKDTEAYASTPSQLAKFLKGYDRPDRLGSDNKMAEAIERLEKTVEAMQARIAVLEGLPGTRVKGDVTPELDFLKLFELNKDKLVGPAGPAGKGGKDGADANTTDITRRLSHLEDWTSSFKARVRLRLVPRETK
jgi:S1-C subfamily serine protease